MEAGLGFRKACHSLSIAEIVSISPSFELTYFPEYCAVGLLVCFGDWRQSLCLKCEVSHSCAHEKTTLSWSCLQSFYLCLEINLPNLPFQSCLPFAHFIWRSVVKLFHNAGHWTRQHFVSCGNTGAHSLLSQAHYPENHQPGPFHLLGALVMTLLCLRQGRSFWRWGVPLCP